MAFDGEGIDRFVGRRPRGFDPSIEREAPMNPKKLGADGTDVIT